MSELKTKANQGNVSAFLDAVEPEERREDCRAIAQMMTAVTGAEPKMWGDKIVGFGTYRYKYASGREGDWMEVGFSPRAKNLTMYVMSGFSDYEALMAKLGKYKTGKSCLYVNRLADIDQAVLRELIESSVAYIRKTYG